MRKNGNGFNLLKFFRDFFVHIELKTIERVDKDIIVDRVMLTTVINEAWRDNFKVAGMYVRLLNFRRAIHPCP